MLPEIALMIGLYIITRMFAVLTRMDERRDRPIVVILAGITVVVTVFVVADLFIRGSAVLGAGM
jgi:hypothetical protein